MTCIVRRVVAMFMLCMVAATAAFADGLVPKQNEKGLWGCVNEAGKWVVKPKYLGATKMFRYSINANKVGRNCPTSGYYGMIQDQNGWGVFAVAVESKSGSSLTISRLVGSKGSFISDRRFEDVGEVVGRLVEVKSNGKWGVIRIPEIQEEFECVYDTLSIVSLNPSIVRVVKDGKADISLDKDMYVERNVGDFDNCSLVCRKSGYGECFLFDANWNLLHKFDNKVRVVNRTFIDDKANCLYDADFNKTKEFYSCSFGRDYPIITITEKHAGAERMFDCRSHRYLTEEPYSKVDSRGFSESGYGIATIYNRADGTMIGQPFTKDGELLEKTPPIKYVASGLCLNMQCQNPTDNKWGFLGPKGSIIVPMEYDAVRVERRGGRKVLAAVKDGKTVIFDYEGNQLGTRDFKLSHDFVATNSNGKKAFVDESEKVFSPWFDAIVAFRSSDGFREEGPLYIVKSGGKYGLYNRVTRKQVAPCVYDGISNVEVDNRIIIQQGTLCGVIDTQGKVILTPKYMGITPYVKTLSGTVAGATVKQVATGYYRVYFLDVDGNPIQGLEDIYKGSQCNFGYKKHMPDLSSKGLPFGTTGVM